MTRQRLRQVPAQLQAQNYLEATQSLQQLLERDDESFMDSNKDNSPSQSLKHEILKQLSALPEPAQDVYELQYGPIARRLLNQAIADSNVDLLQTLNRRYLHTAAGTEGVYRLAGMALDEGNYLTAARLFEHIQLFGQSAARARLEPGLSLKSALAWHRQGNPERASAILTELQQRKPKVAITLGGEQTPLLETPQAVLAWLDQRVAHPESHKQNDLADWRMVGGDASRAASSQAMAPYLSESRRASLLTGLLPDSARADKVAEHFREQYTAFQLRQSQTQAPSIPAWQPIVVSGLAIVRTLSDLRAYRLDNGKLAWATVDKDDLLARMYELNFKDTLVTNMFQGPRMMWQRAWLDGTYGTLSSDGRLVYSIDEVDFVDELYRTPGLTNGLYTARRWNRLRAHNVQTGQLVSEYSTGDGGDEAQYFFLGPPLPLGDRLYCIAQATDELHLVVFRISDRGLQKDWSQPLLTAGLSLSQDPNRRFSGISPAFGGGLMICPTESGGVIAFDLATRAFAWGYVYTKHTVLEQRVLRVESEAHRLSSRQQTTFGGNDENRWLDSASFVTDKYVVLTLRDLDELHCLNLANGSLVWKRPREEGLFVAGIHDGNVLVVSRGYVQAYRLADGKPAWPQPLTIPLPSGHGIRHGSNYYLPLSTAEVVTIDLKSGRVIASSRSRDGIIPGNLAGADGRIVSQSIENVDFFPQYDTLETLVTARLLKNPQDVAALVLRAEIELQRGRPQGALASLREALAIKTDDPAINAQLIASLLEGLRIDFAAYRQLASEIDRLAARPEDRGALLFALVTGFEKQGEIREAFAAGLKFCESKTAADELERVDDKLSVRRDQLVFSRLRALYTKADPTLRKDLDNLIRTAFAAARERRDAAELSRWLDGFETLIPATEARQMLVELLAKQGTPLEREQILIQLRNSSEKKVAGTALAQTVELMLQTERPAEVPALLIALRRDFASVECLDGKTGAQLVADWEKHLAVASLLKLARNWPDGKVEVTRLKKGRRAAEFRFQQLPVQIVSGTAFEGARLEVNPSGNELAAWDRFGRLWWSLELQNPDMYAPPQSIRAWACEHLLIVAFQRKIIAIDILSVSKPGTPELPAAAAPKEVKPDPKPGILKVDPDEDAGEPDLPEPRVLWQQTDTARTSFRSEGVINGRQRMQIMDERGRPTGAIGPVTDRYIGIQRGRKLIVLESLTGRILWSRDLADPIEELAGDSEVLLAIPSGAGQGDLFSIEDGTPLGKQAVPLRDVRELFVGCSALVWETTADSSQRRLLLRDVKTQTNRWERLFPADSILAIPDRKELSVVEPQGRFVMLRTDTGQPLLETRLETDVSIERLAVLKSLDRLIVIAGAAPVPTPQPVRSSDINSIVVSGTIFGIDRDSGKRLWSTPVEEQAINPYQSTEFPLIVFAGLRLEPGPNPRIMTQSTVLFCLDPRNGRVVFNKSIPNEYLINQRVMKSTTPDHLELRLTGSVLDFLYTDKTSETEPAKPAPGAPPAKS